MELKRIFQAHESEKIGELLPKLFLSLVFLLAISYIISPNDAFAQMESMTIEGPKHPLVNSVFNVYVDVEGVSRASHGIFRMVMTIYEKNSGEVMVAVPDYLLSGINTIQINMIPDRNTEPLKEGISYILKIQHVNIISEHEFIPIKITRD